MSRYSELASTIIEDLYPDATAPETAQLLNIIYRTLITDHAAYYSALLKYFPEDCI